MSTTATYIGQELDVFAHAKNWKQYWSGFLRPWIRGNVLEVGAGIGTNTVLLRSFTEGEWTCLEPDGKLLERLQATCDPRERRLRTMEGTLANLPADVMFDTIIYIDVLEHIEDDAGELCAAAGHLEKGGNLIVLAPAHQWLYTEFDKAIGHFRRYTKRSLRRAAVGSGLNEKKVVYVDSVGLLASLGNAMLLRKSQPSVRQILFWDRALVPISRIVDPLAGRSIGKSVVGVWAKPTV